MTIRVKIALVLAAAVVVPLAASTAFWIRTFHHSVERPPSTQDLLFASADRLYGKIGDSFAELVQARSDQAAKWIGREASRFSHDAIDLHNDLDKLGCLRVDRIRGQGCRNRVDQFLTLHHGNLAGVRVAWPGGSFDFPQPAGNLASALATIESRSRQGSLQVLPTQAGAMFFVHHSKYGGYVIAWGGLEALRKTLEQMTGSPLSGFALVGPGGELLFPLRFKPPGAEPFSINHLNNIRYRGRASDVPAWVAAGTPNPVTLADDRRYLIRFAKIEGSDVGVAYLIDLPDLPHLRFADALRRYGLLGAVLLVLAFVGSGLLANRLTGRLRALRAAAEQFGAGKLDAPVDVSGDDEVAGLAVRFRAMADQLREHIVTL